MAGNFSRKEVRKFRTYEEPWIYAREKINTSIGARNLTSSSVPPPPKPPPQPPLLTAANIEFIFLNTTLCLKELTASIVPTATSPAPQPPEPQLPALQNLHPVTVTATRSLDYKLRVASNSTTSSKPTTWGDPFVANAAFSVEVGLAKQVWTRHG